MNGRKAAIDPPDLDKQCKLKTASAFMSELDRIGLGFWGEGKRKVHACMLNALVAYDELISDIDGSSTVPGDLSCPKCGKDDFADPETRSFVQVNGGSYAPGANPTVYWVEGWIVCRECGHTEWASDSS